MRYLLVSSQLLPLLWSKNLKKPSPRGLNGIMHDLTLPRLGGIKIPALQQMPSIYRKMKKFEETTT